ncbi:MAG: outer membrane protein assembly factor BamE [Sinobacterium sp.]|jgi:outer membrane protein assembly factor BamE
MQKLALIFLLLTITACSEFPLVYKIDIEQGNIIEQEAVDQLIPGLTKSQVRFILGTPINIDTFNQQRWDYIYSMSRGGGGHRQERLSLYFVDDRLEYFQGDFIPTGVIDDEQATEEGIIKEQEKPAEAEAEAIIQSVDDAGAGDMEEIEDGILQIRIQDDEGTEQRVK